MVNKFDPEKYALSGTEDAQQIALFGWASQKEVLDIYPDLRWMFAVPNGGFRTKAGAGKLRAMGLKKGVPDIFLPVKRGEYSGLFIELKREERDGKRKGQAQAEQKVWLEGLRLLGFGAMICYSFEDAKATVMAYLNWGKE